MIDIPRCVRRMRLLVFIILGLALVAQPAQAGWLSGRPLQRIDNVDGSTTYFWSANSPSECQWEGQRTFSSLLRLVFRSGRLYFSWSPRPVPEEETVTPGTTSEPVPDAPKPEPEPVPEPAKPEEPKPEPEPVPVPPQPEPEPAPQPPKPDPEPEPEPKPEPAPETVFMNEWETELFELVNQERTSRGLRPLEADEELVNVARLKSQDMVDHNYFAHQSPTYGSPFEMMRNFGITYRMAGENLAAAFSVPSAHQALMNSPGHRANLLNANYTHVGIGIVPGSTYPVMVTQMFIAR